MPTGLPPGLAINSSTGAVTGTPVTGGDYTFTVRAKDSLGNYAFSSQTVRISSFAVTLTLPVAFKEASYSGSVDEQGGTSPFVYSINTGTLPTGLSLASSTGLITGTVDMSATTQALTFEVTDADSLFGLASGTITVLGVCPTWDTSTINGTIEPSGLVNAHGLFIAITGGSSGQEAWTSPTGDTWTSRNLSFAGQDAMSIATSGSLTIVVGNSANSAYTSNGTSWTNVALPGTSTNYGSVFQGNGVFLATSSVAAIIRRTTDGVTWTQPTSAIGGVLNRYAYGGGVHVLGTSSTGLQSSPDGTTWTSRTSASTSVNQIIYANSLFVAVGNSGQIQTSPDGVTWTSRTSGTSNALNTVIWFNSLFIAAGSGGTIVTSPDGVTWTTRTSGTSNALYMLGATDYRVIVGGDSGTVLSSTNGTDWTSCSSGTSSYLTLTATGSNEAVCLAGQSSVSVFGLAIA